MVDGLRIIFDFTVDNLLLYGEERHQFSEIRHITVEVPVRPLNRCAHRISNLQLADRDRLI